MNDSCEKLKCSFLLYDSQNMLSYAPMLLYSSVQTISSSYIIGDHEGTINFEPKVKYGQ